MARLVPKSYKDKEGVTHVTSYHAEFYNRNRSPRRKRVSLGTRDEKTAELKMASLERDEALGVYDPWTDGTEEAVTYAEAKKRFVRRQKRLGRSDDTVHHYDVLLDRLADSLPPAIGMRDVKCRHIEAFLDGCDIGASSTKNYTRHFRTFFNWATKKGYIDRVPFTDDFREHVRSLRDDPLPSFYTYEQFERLCEEADKLHKTPYHKRYVNPSWVADAIRGLFIMGNRPKELETLAWRDVDLSSGYVRFRKTKTGKPRRVPIPKRLVRYFEEMAARRLAPDDPSELVFKTASGQPLTKNNRRNVGRRVKKLAKKLGMPEDIKALYGLRHGHATHHTMQGTPTRIVSGVMGHERLSTMDNYSHFIPEEGKKHQDRVFGEGQEECEECAKLRKETRKLKARIKQLKARAKELETESNVKAGTRSLENGVYLRSEEEAVS